MSQIRGETAEALATPEHPAASLLARCLQVVSSLALLLLFSEPSFAQITAIRAGTVVDPADASIRRNQVILIEGWKIKAIGGGLDIPADAAVIDLSDRTVLPGLIDAHTHLAAIISAKWDLADDWIMSVQRRTGYRAILAARNARDMLDAGFTTVRDVGNAGDYIDMDLEKAIRFRKIIGPTIVPAGRIIAPFGGQFHDTPTDGRLLYQPEYSFADSQDELRKAIRENIYWGAKVIKIVVDAKPYQYSTDDILFIVAEATRAGVNVAAHVQTEPAPAQPSKHTWPRSNMPGC